MKILGLNLRQGTPTRRQSKLPGFTIVELLIVIVVIGILAAISIVAYNGIQIRAIDTSTKHDAAGASKQLELLKIGDGSYPSNTDSLKKSSSTVFAYNTTTEGFELTVSADRDGTKAYCVSSSNLTPTDGKCASHQDTVASCFTFNASSYRITGYSDDSSCPRNVVIPKEIDGREVRDIGGSAFSQWDFNSGDG